MEETHESRTFCNFAAYSRLPSANSKYVPANSPKVMTRRNSARKRHTFVRREHMR